MHASTTKYNLILLHALPFHFSVALITSRGRRERLAETAVVQEANAPDRWTSDLAGLNICNHDTIILELSTSSVRHTRLLMLCSRRVCLQAALKQALPQQN